MMALLVIAKYVSANDTSAIACTFVASKKECFLHWLNDDDVSRSLVELDKAKQESRNDSPVKTSRFADNDDSLNELAEKASTG